LNLNNLGCSWSLCEVYAENHAQTIMGARNKDGYVILATEVNADQIDWSNTLYATEQRPNEYEVVFYGTVLASVHSSHRLEIDGEFAGIAATDSSFDDYNDNYDGDLTKADFFAIALEF